MRALRLVDLPQFDLFICSLGVKYPGSLRFFMDNSWFKIKGYVHIGMPLKQRDFKKVYNFVRNPENVRKYAFLPLIHREHITPKYGYKDGHRHKKLKHRHICFASHFDAQIYSYYSSLLS